MPKLDKPYQIRLSERFWSEVDDWRALQRPVPTRAEAVRLLVETGLIRGDQTMTCPHCHAEATAIIVNDAGGDRRRVECASDTSHNFEVTRTSWIKFTQLDLRNQAERVKRAKKDAVRDQLPLVTSFHM
ncbi:MAG: hypothetical protein AB7T59_19635 [Hyphomonadaceae bacterium]